MMRSLGSAAPRGLLLAFVWAVPLSVDTIRPEAGAAVPAMVQRFLARTDVPVTSYRALRRLEAHNARYRKHGWLEAWTTLDADGFGYEIVGEGGSSYVRGRVLRKALEREAEAYARAETGTAAIVPANYEFAERPADADGLVAIALTPRRREPLLVQGSLYLTADDADLVRIEGQLARNPSFWTRRVHVVRHYGRVADVRVPLMLESTAQVVVAGDSSFVMRYEYASINGRPVGSPQPRASDGAAERR